MANQISEQLLALADEVVALSRCGMPLETGLYALGKELPAKTGRLIQEMGADLQSGKSLETAMSERSEFSPLFRTVVLAGIRSGDLPAAVERLATAIRTSLGLRTTLRLSLIYPLLVATAAYALFVFAAFLLFPQVQETYVDHLMTPPRWPFADWLYQNPWQWVWAPPVLGIAIAVWGWRHGALPFLGRPLYGLQQTTNLAIFSELLSLLVDHGEPLADSLELAAASTNDSRLMSAANRVSSELRAGAAPTKTPHAARLPPLLVWSLQSARNPEQLSESLRRAAVAYRGQADMLAQWCELYLPALMVVSIGGFATLVYALSMVVPWSQIIMDLIKSI